MERANVGHTQVRSEGIYAWCGTGALTVFVMGIALVVGLWFTSMLFLVRGLVDATSASQVMSADSGYERAVQ